MSTFFGFTDPFEDLLDMQRQMTDLMNALGTPAGIPTTTGGVPLLTTGDVGGRGLGLAPRETLTTTGGGKSRGWSPSLDVCETDKSLVLHAELPGCNKEDIKLSIDNNRLVLTGTKRAHKKEKGEKWVRRERFRGSFYRTLPLPRNVDVEHIEASFDNGILEVVVPKSQALAKRQTIDIKSAQGLTTKPQEQQKLKQKEKEKTTAFPQQPTTEETTKPEETQQPRSEFKPEVESQQLQEKQRGDIKFEGQQLQEPPQPPQPPQLPQEQKFEQPKQEQAFAQGEKTLEQQQPLEQQQQQEKKKQIDIKFGEQQPELQKDQQEAKLQEGAPSSVFIQGSSESGQVSQEREKGSFQAM